MRMFTTTSLQLAVALSLCCTAFVAGDDDGDDICTPVPGRPKCVCRTPDGVIDLTSLPILTEPDSLCCSIGRQINGGCGLHETRFKNVHQSDHTFSYSYNPCNPFSCGEDTSSVVCQEGSGIPPTSCGHSEEQSMDMNNGKYVLRYLGGIGDRMSLVTLECDRNATNPVLTAFGEKTNNLVYEFNLKTKCACPGVCYNSSGSSGSSGNTGSKGSGVPVGYAGTVLLFLMLVSVLSYFIIGMVLSVSSGKRGLDIIPQKDLWFGLCGLVKDGCVFTCSPLCSSTKRLTSGYDKL